MKLEERTLRLIAVGASITANCQPCLQVNMTRARECGADEEEIREAIRVGRLVRRGAAAKMDDFATTLQQAIETAAGPAGAACGCSQPADPQGRECRG